MLISSYYYTLGPAGNRLSVVEQSGRTVNYTYDALYRLTQEAITDPALGNETIGYTYDAFGNRLTKTDSDGTISYTYDANDRMLSEAGPTSIATYTYDDNGNTLSKTEGVGTTLYSYDFENRLVGVNTAAGATAYGYDSDGIRVAKSTGTVITRYLVDKNRDYAQVLEETDNSSLTVSYVYGDDLISQNRGSSYYYLYDGQMSTRQLVDNSEAVLNEYTYDAFGIILGQAGVVANNYMYTGEQFDPNAGFYYLRARYYNQGVGRFVTVDPWKGNIHEPVSLHKYLYANADPVNNVDYSGKFTLATVMSSTVIRGILINFATSAVIGGIDAALRDEPILSAAFESGLVGAILGPIGVIKYLRPVLVVGGLGVGLLGVVDAVDEGNPELAVFRSLLVLNGARSFIKSLGPGGRLGKRPVRAQNRAIADELKARGWEIKNGGGYGPEEYLAGPGGARKGSNYVDITATKNGKTIRIQTVTTTDGVNPTLQEAAAAAMIRQKTPPGDHLILIPKQNWSF
ncbi:MAG: RHS repeat-associated core domain-containing protein [Pseudomonadota bacterium]